MENHCATHVRMAVYRTIPPNSTHQRGQETEETRLMGVRPINISSSSSSSSYYTITFVRNGGSVETI